MSILNSNKEKVKQEVEALIKEEGAQLVEFSAFYLRGKHNLRCLIDYPQGGITVGTLSRINSRIVSYLDTSGLLGNEFTVEVNSPGLDRKLKNASDFLRIKGKEVCLWLLEHYQDRDYLEAEVVDVANDKLVLKCKGEIFELNLDQVKVGKEKIKI